MLTASNRQGSIFLFGKLEHGARACVKGYCRHAQQSTCHLAPALPNPLQQHDIRKPVFSSEAGLWHHNAGRALALAASYGLQTHPSGTNEIWQAALKHKPSKARIDGLWRDSCFDTEPYIKPMGVGKWAV